MAKLDLRPLPPAQRHTRVYEALDALAPGETLEIVNDHLPTPLRYELEATRPGQYEWEDGPAGPEVFGARVTCRARILDVRPMLARGEEPFEAIMATVSDLEPGQDLVIVAPFEPVPLEGVLSSQGFTYDVATIGEDWRVSFHPPG